MRKTLTFFLLILLSTLLAAAYGALHDQVSYTLCPEYYTRFKFIEFSMAPDANAALQLAHPRYHVALVGVIATWWFGAFLGIILGLVSLIFKGWNAMFRMGAGAILRTLGIAVIFGIAGYFYGRFYLATIGVNWPLPDHLVHRDDFISVGSMHNFGYLGGIVGMLAGIVYLVRERIRMRRRLAADLNNTI